MALPYELAQFARPPARSDGERVRRISPRTQLIATALFAVVVAVLPPALGVVAIAGVAALALFLTTPVIALYGLLFAVPFESLRNIQAGGLNVTVTELVVFCLGVAWVGWAASTRRIAIGPVPWRWALLLYGAVIAFSITQASDFAASLKEMLKWGELLFAYLVGATLVRDRADLRRVLLVLFLAVIAESAVGLAQTILHSGPSSFGRGAFLRASGTFDQPNPYAGYLNMCFPLAVTCLAYRVFPRRLMWLVVVVSGGGVLASLSRGGELASITALLVMGMLVSAGVRLLAGLGAVALAVVLAGVVAGVIPTSITDPIGEGLGVSNLDVVNPTPVTWAAAERLAHMEAGLAMWGDHPLLGVGIGNYGAQYDRYKVADVWKLSLAHAHNYYINIGAEAGVLGLVAFLLLIGSAVVICVRAFRRAEEPLTRAAALGALGVMVGIAVHSFFDDVFVHGMEVQMALVMVVASRAGAGFATRVEEQGR